MVIFTNDTIGEGFLMIGICLCILDTCGGSFEEKSILFTIPGVSCIIDDFLGNVLHFL